MTREDVIKRLGESFMRPEHVIDETPWRLLNGSTISQALKDGREDDVDATLTAFEQGYYV